ncbi:MAG: translation initiation factor IF-3 [Candidatus Andersenbacteria bacterium]
MPSGRRRFRARPKPQVKRPPANDEIRSTEVRLIGPAGEQYGVVPSSEARQKALEAGTDLVMVAEKAVPPVVRIMDLGKHMYEKRKKEAKQKAHSKSGEIKGIRIGFKMGEHDWGIRLNQAEEFLQGGNKVKLEMRLHGREKGRVDMATQKMKDFVAMIPGGATPEGGLSRSPNSLSIVIARSRASKVDKPDEAT